MDINEENQNKCVEIVGGIEELLKKHGYDVVLNNSEKPFRERKKSISGEMLWFYCKNSKGWPQNSDSEKRTGYCLFLTADERFEFQLRCGRSKIGYETFKGKEFKGIIDNLNKICEYRGWKVDRTLTNAENDGQGNSKEGMHVIIASKNLNNNLFDDFVEQLDNWNLSNIATFNIYKELVKTKTAEEIIMAEQMKEITELLINNHNIILHGAPGTGKTYLAKEIAIDLIFENENDRKLIRKKEKEIQASEKEMYQALNAQLNEQCGFVQFHQSYDYTDFVEGLRPKDDGEGKIGFERKDGIFKIFCERAVQSLIGQDNFEETYDKLIKLAKEKKLVEISSLSDSSIAISLQENENGFVLWLKNDKGEYKKTEWGYFNFEQCYKIYKGEAGIPSENQDNYRKAIVKYMKDCLNLKEYIAPEKKPFIFIIDEINRGEMSKIFGELFFSIDPGYRGKKGKIKTQYANLQEKPNEFDSVLGIKQNVVKGNGKDVDKNIDNYGHFFVPENVYIIGTMNDIDRSVESMDFAMRRRFAFKEIKAEDSRESMFGNGAKWKNGNNDEIDVSSCLENIKNRMNNLNNVILNKEFHLGQAYQIGGAYFLKFANYCETNGNKVEGEQKEAFDSLWKNHIEGVLREYLRGMDNVEGEDGKLKKLEKAYNLEDIYKEDGTIDKGAKKGKQSDAEKSDKGDEEDKQSVEKDS